MLACVSKWDSYKLRPCLGILWLTYRNGKIIRLKLYCMLSWKKFRQRVWDSTPSRQIPRRLQRNHRHLHFIEQNPINGWQAILTINRIRKVKKVRCKQAHKDSSKGIKCVLFRRTGAWRTRKNLKTQSIWCWLISNWKVKMALNFNQFSA